jgi:hypothetical protein
MASVDRQSNTAEAASSYSDPRDPDYQFSVVPNTKTEVEPEAPPIIVKKVGKQRSRRRKIFIGAVAMLICIFILYGIVSLVSNFSSSTFISKYDNFNNSNFTNKDQYEDPNGGPNDYDIHYLVEQMIYKEFSPTDKKKYLDLPKVVKEQYIQDYLIQKI